MSAPSRITREELVEQSVEDYLRYQIFTVRGYPGSRVELVDAFVEAGFDGPLAKNYLALGFNFDDGGTPAELGSALVFRQYMIEVWVIGLSAAEGRNLANAVRDSMESTALVPLKDITDPLAPVIDQLQVDPVRVQRQPVPNPKPWQEFLWIVTVPVLDVYNAARAATAPPVDVEPTGGSFPTNTTPSDTFNRANEFPLSAAAGWAQSTLRGSATASDMLGVYGNIAASNSVGETSQVWSATLPADAECYTTIVAGKPASGRELCGLYLRLTNVGVAFRGLALTVTETAGAEDWKLYKILSGVFTQLGATVAQAVDVGDKIGFRVVGDVLTGYRYDGSSWAQVITATDASVIGPGQAALEAVQNTSTGFDDWTVGPV